MSCAEFAPLLELLPLIYDEGDELQARIPLFSLDSPYDTSRPS